jgi:hypothetical protein
MKDEKQQEILPLLPERERKMHKIQAWLVTWKTLQSEQFGKNHPLSLLNVIWPKHKLATMQM